MPLPFDVRFVHHAVSAHMPQKQFPIVIVEDDEGMRQAIARLLRAAGYATAAFESAEALLAASVAGRAACLVLDVRLPGISGFDLRRRLANGGTNVPVIFVSAHDEPAMRETAVRIGAEAYLHKPFSRSALLEAISRVVPAAGKEDC
jgi:FixJ family two-component response regulator